MIFSFLSGFGNSLSDIHQSEQEFATGDKSPCSLFEEKGFIPICPWKLFSSRVTEKHSEKTNEARCYSDREPSHPRKVNYTTYKYKGRCYFTKKQLL